MTLKMPWSDWFVSEAKRRKTIQPWIMADIELEEELDIEIILRAVINSMEPEEIPDLISAFAKENYRLVKIIKQAGNHIDKLKSKDSSPKNKHNPLPKLLR
tara:strand:+ start:122 stop:424 length:303 start_codon:yes stop_codon:yes gene_type:complete